MSKCKVYTYKCDLCGIEKSFDKELTEIQESEILRDIQVPARTEGRFTLCKVQLCNECAKKYAEHVWEKYDICDEYGFWMKEKNDDKS